MKIQQNPLQPLIGTTLSVLMFLLLLAEPEWMSVEIGLGFAYLIIAVEIIVVFTVFRIIYSSSENKPINIKYSDKIHSFASVVVILLYAMFLFIGTDSINSSLQVFTYFLGFFFIIAILIGANGERGLLMGGVIYFVAYGLLQLWHIYRKSKLNPAGL